MSEQKAAGYNVGYEMKIEVLFSDPVKAESYFIKGDWRNYFFKLDDMEELSIHIADMFHATPDYWHAVKKEHCKFIEGFGLFVPSYGNPRRFTSDIENDSDYGRIVIYYEQDLESNSVEQARNFSL